MRGFIWVHRLHPDNGEPEGGLCVSVSHIVNFGSDGSYTWIETDGAELLRVAETAEHLCELIKESQLPAPEFLEMAAALTREARRIGGQ